MRSPALRGEALKAVAATEQRLAEAIARRCGLDAERDLYPKVVAAVVSGAARAGIGHWQRSGTAEGFGDVLAEAIRLGMAGIA
jgi:hypothetical protein